MQKTTIVVLLMLWDGLAGGQVKELPERPPGEFFRLTAQDHRDAASFKRGEPVVGTTYFYWYDIDTNSHILSPDGEDYLTTHPADMSNLSYKRVSWHKSELLDMIDAGIDFVMPVYWGVPGDYDGWSFAGLPPLVEAHGELEKAGQRPPAIGMFYDTSILQHNRFHADGSNYHVDLTTDFGRRWFYTAIRDFFSLVPPAKWARVDGKPIIFLYEAAFAANQDPEQQFAFVKERFADDFGVEPFLVKSAGWQGQADATYAWGGAVSGPILFEDVAALGPGYDHSAVPGREPLIIERRDGQTYVERWTKLLHLDPKRRPWMVHVETWNEWHEGTDIAHSREYGRSYTAFSECTRKPGVPFAEGSRLATAALHVDHRAGQPSGHGTAKSAPKCGMKAAAESVSEGARAARSSVDGSTFAGAPTPHGREFRPADRQLGHLRIMTNVEG